MKATRVHGRRRQIDLLGIDPDRPRLSPRQVTQVREALESPETLVEWATPPDTGTKPRKR